MWARGLNVGIRLFFITYMGTWVTVRLYPSRIQLPMDIGCVDAKFETDSKYRTEYALFPFSNYGQQIISTKHNRIKIETIDYKQ